MRGDFRISLGAKIAYATNYDIRTKPHVWRDRDSIAAKRLIVSIMPPFGWLDYSLGVAVTCKTVGEVVSYLVSNRTYVPLVSQLTD